MPGTHEEIIEIAQRLARMEIHPDGILPDIVWQDGTHITEEEQRHVCALGIYEMRLMFARSGRRRKAQIKAGRLLRSLLTPGELAELRRNRYFNVMGSAGGIYQITPETGSVRRVERHGNHWYTVQRFCIHEVEGDLPAADVSIGHLLFLKTDEPEFLRIANASRYRLPDCWNSEYMRRRRQIMTRNQPAIEGDALEMQAQ